MRAIVIEKPGDESVMVLGESPAPLPVSGPGASVLKIDRSDSTTPFFSPDHHAVAFLKPPDPPTRPDIDKMEA